jgi:ribonuclease P protein component
VETLKTSGQFERVRRAGRSWASGPVVLNAAPNGREGIRCGFVVGKKVGGAVSRNRARRRIREAIRQKLPLLKPGYDLVWIARSSIIEADFDSIQAAVDDVLRRGKLYGPADSVTNAAQSRIMFEDKSPVSGENETALGPAENGSNPEQK